MTESTRVVARRTAFQGVTSGSSRPRLTVGVAPAAARSSVRFAVGSQSVPVAIDGLDFGTAINRWSGMAERLAMRLGPDEWLVIVPQADGDGLEAALARALAGRPHAIVDVSHRQAALTLHGAAAADVLNSGCPLDLHPTRFATGAATRTLFHKAEIVLARIDDIPTYRLEVARSFAPYVAAMIEQVATVA